VNHALLAQVRAKAQQGIADRLFAQANASDDQLRQLARNIAAATGSTPVFGPVKDRGRAAEKVAADYGGDWYDLKDAVRLTLIAPDAGGLRRIQHEVRARCRPEHGLGLLKDLELHPQMSPCGYSGLNFVVRLRNGQPGEIQANVAEMMYAKMKEKSFRESLGDALYTQIRGRYLLTGGLSHVLYEVYRVAPASPAGQRAAALSRAYHDYFRRSPDARVRMALERDLTAFRAAHPQVFVG
jgi:hypothetical protein